MDNKKINWIISIIFALVYLSVSFIFDIWNYSWIIWIIYAIYRSMIN